MDCEQVEKRNMIDQYILGELSDVDKTASELHFFACDSCFHELKQREQLIHLIKNEGQHLFPEYETGKKNNTTRSKNLSTTKFRSPTSPKRWYPVYAAAAVLLILISSYFSLHHVFQSEFLSTIHFDDQVPYDYFPDPVFRGNSNTESLLSFRNNFSIAMLDYINLNYNRAISSFKSMAPEIEQLKPDMDQERFYSLLREYHFYFGISCLAAAISKKTSVNKACKDTLLQQATLNLTKSRDLALTYQSNMIDKDYYFLALVFAFTGQTHKAVTELQKIERDNYYYPKAVYLLEEINR